jgi:hypothetical protein
MRTEWVLVPLSGPPELPGGSQTGFLPSGWTCAHARPTTLQFAWLLDATMGLMKVDPCARSTRSAPRSRRFGAILT